jgi:hypothetical protein
VKAYGTALWPPSGCGQETTMMACRQDGPVDGSSTRRQPACERCRMRFLFRIVLVLAVVAIGTYVLGYWSFDQISVNK